MEFLQQAAQSKILLCFLLACMKGAGVALASAKTLQDVLACSRV